MSASSRLTFDRIVRELRRREFGVLSTVASDGRPHSAAVVYGVSGYGRPFRIYVMTPRERPVAHDIIGNPDVSFVVPLTRRLLRFLSFGAVQFQGRAEVVDWDDSGGVEAFYSFATGRRILSRYDELHRRRETQACFIRITPERTLSTCGVGRSIWDQMHGMDAGVDLVRVP